MNRSQIAMDMSCKLLKSASGNIIYSPWEITSLGLPISGILSIMLANLEALKVAFKWTVDLVGPFWGFVLLCWILWSAQP